MNKMENIDYRDLGHYDGFYGRYGRSVMIMQLSEAALSWYNEGYAEGKYERQAEERM